MKWLTVLVIFCSIIWGRAEEEDDENEKTTPPLPCPKNEVWESCVENLCIAKLCSDLGYPLNCTKVPDKDCTAGCICVAGYLRNKLGKCVPIKDCPSCGGDPHATLGCNNYCRHSCSDYLDLTKDCPPGCVQNGCKCRDGYVYNEILKRCVRPKDCPKSCGPNAIRIRCVIKNPPTCANPNPKPCPNNKEDCTKLGCKCIDGYILDKIGGTCIKVGDCPKSCKDPNAEWKKCGPGCPPSCDNYRNTCLVCTLPCKAGCFCKKGYVLDSKGKCIKPKHCPHKCGKNEYWDWCPPNCPHQRCSAIWSKFDCSKSPKCCIPQCRCRNGYYRNDKGICITIKECLHNHKCGPHAHYNDCHNGPKGCKPGCVCDEGYTKKGDVCVKDNTGDCGPHAIRVHCKIRCPPTCANPNPKMCIPYFDCDRSGCKCIDGYILDKIGGKCIKVGDCPKSCKDPNAEWKKCGPGCPPSCDNYRNTCLVCPLPCKAGCFCKKGYVLDSKGNCIKPKYCPHKCGKNEYWDWCPPNCPHQRCSAIWSKFDCSKAPKCCIPQCRCRSGYYRNDKGICITIKECLHNPKCGPHAHYNDCHNAPKGCKPGCVCDEGYTKKGDVCVKDNTGDCGPHAIRVHCKIRCPPTCANPNPKMCIPYFDCDRSGCKCIDGYILDKIGGKCIKVGDCPKSCKDPNAEWKKCGPGCPPSCDNYRNTCLVCPLPCKAGCFCKKGYVLDSKGNCIKPKYCPHKCGKNEYWDWCPPNCPHQRCSAIWSKFDCSKAPKCCIPQCRCRNGYYRNDKGICITIKECLHNHKCGPHAHYNDCRNGPKGCKPGCVCDEGYTKKGDVCVKNTGDCGPHAIMVHCKIRCPPTCANPNPKMCIPYFDCNKSGCKCVDGYILDKIGGKCIKVGDCPKSCRDPNAEWKKCGPGCPPSCDNYRNTCLVCPLPCKPGCFCKKGYVLDSKGNCIKPKDCPHKCGKNEYWDWCPPNCPHQKCSTIWSKFDCKAPKCCIPQCRCRNGYYRNNKGICVTIKECLHKCGPNQHYIDCKNACKNDGCKPGCVCDEGYIWKGDDCVRDDDDCDDLCGEHAYWSECINPCPKGSMCFVPCIAGCLCDEGYEQVNGCCVKKNKCPKNEEYLVDTNKCQITCKNMHLEHLMGPCGKASGCYCIKDYVRDANGRCVKRTDCPGKHECGEHAHWSECINPCPKGSMCFVPCIAGCLCDKGYEQVNGVCVKKHNCPKNEDFLVDTNQCQITCKNMHLEPVMGQCAKTTGCFCNKDYVRDANGHCIKRSDCPTYCKDPLKEWNDCGSACPPSCDNYNHTCISCIDKCEPGCFCKKEYVLNSEGKCIVPDDCPRNCGEHEFWDWCPPNCPPQNCSALWTKIDCKYASTCCIPQCRCKSGYYRNRDGICITSDKCKYDCGKNAHYNDCSDPDKNDGCTPGCKCDEGYTKKGDICISDVKGERCGENEHWTDCVNPCPIGKICAPCMEGCLCNTGYVRKGGVCIEKDNNEEEDDDN